MTIQENKQWLTACSEDDLVAHSGVAALIKEKQIALFYLPDNDNIYAVDNYCPFSDANVISRGIVGDIKGKIVVASPLYKQHFCLQSGDCLEDDSVSINRYDVKIENGTIHIAL